MKRRFTMRVCDFPVVNYCCCIVDDLRGLVLVVLLQGAYTIRQPHWQRPSAADRQMKAHIPRCKFNAFATISLWSWVIWATSSQTMA